MEFSSRGRARGRAALRDDGISTSAGASIARLDQANEKRHCCKESGCDRTFQTKVSYFGTKLFRNLDISGLNYCICVSLWLDSYLSGIDG